MTFSKNRLNSKQEEKVVCQTPTPGKKPTRIAKWKYRAIENAILKILPKSGEGVLFKELPDLVKNALSDEELTSLGSVAWYTTVVKLDMEVRGKIARIKKTNPQRLIRK